MNTKEQGAIGVGRAVSYYMNRGYSVFTPIADTKRCDLIVLTDDEILRVEVKTTKAKNDEVQLRTLGGNQSWNGVSSKISSNDCDKVFIVNLNTGTEIEIDSKELDGRSSIRIH